MFPSPAQQRSPRSGFRIGHGILACLLFATGCGPDGAQEDLLQPIHPFERNLAVSEAAAAEAERGPLAAFSARIAGLDVRFEDWVAPGSLAHLPWPAHARALSMGSWRCIVSAARSIPWHGRPMTPS